MYTNIFFLSSIQTFSFLYKNLHFLSGQCYFLEGSPTASMWMFFYKDSRWGEGAGRDKYYNTIIAPQYKYIFWYPCLVCQKITIIFNWERVFVWTRFMFTLCNILNKLFYFEIYVSIWFISLWVEVRTKSAHRV